MKKRASRFGLLFAGVLIGILAGVLLAYWFSNLGWNFSSITNFFSDDKEKSPSISFVNMNKIDLARKKQPGRYLYHKIDSLSSDTAELSLEEFLAYYKDEYPDSVLINAWQYNSENKAKDVVVIKDELLFIEQLKVAGLSEKSDDSDLDSVLIDDRGYKTNKNNILQVEFWKSPINFRGYKWDTRKLVLFGFYEFNFLNIKYFNEEYYMQYGTLFYHLERSDSFLSMSLITDDNLIRELNRL